MVTCIIGNSTRIKCSEIDKKNGFIFMPFDSSENGIYIEPQKKIITQSASQSVFNNTIQHNRINFQNKKKEYISYVSQVISNLKKYKLKKIVASTCLEYKTQDVPKSEIFMRLISLNPRAFSYMFFSEETGVWIGASPEQLVEITKNKLTAHALAATKINYHQKWSNKELNEQQIVLNDMINNLAKFCNDISSSKLQTVSAANLFHLRNSITARPIGKISEIINSLHPTPAVAGSPKQSSIEYILKNEKNNRKYYTGYLGVLKEYDCNLFVNIRCAQIIGNKLKVFVGAGITQESVPESEWDEILEKSKTILRIFSSF
jgi:isochorismate synthase